MRRASFSMDVDVDALGEVAARDLAEGVVHGVDAADDDALQENRDEDEDDGEEDQVGDDEDAENGVARDVHLLLGDGGDKGEVTQVARQAEAGAALDEGAEGVGGLLGGAGFPLAVVNDLQAAVGADAKGLGDVVDVGQGLSLGQAGGTIADLDDAGDVTAGDAGVLEILPHAADAGGLDKREARVFEGGHELGGLLGGGHVEAAIGVAGGVVGRARGHEDAT